MCLVNVVVTSKYSAITLNGVLHWHAKIGPYNTNHKLTFVDKVLDRLGIGLMQPETGFNIPVPATTLFFSFFPSAWQWKVYDLRPYVSPLIDST